MTLCQDLMFLQAYKMLVLPYQLILLSEKQ